MKTSVLQKTVIGLLFCMSASCGGKSTTTYQNDEADFLAYSGNFYEEIIKPEVMAWKEVAAVMFPRVCDDTETQWAAQQVDSMANAIISHPDMPKGEQLAKLYEIQNMTAYGMSYFSAIIGAYSNPDASEQARQMMQISYADIDSLAKVNYNNARMLVLFELSTYHNFSLFMELGSQYSDGEPSFVTQNLQTNAYNAAKVSELFKHMKNEVQAYRYASFIDNTTFFMTFCPLAFWLSAGTNFQTSHQSEYIEMGTWFDNEVASVNSAIENNSILSLPEISTTEFSERWKKSASYRTQLITNLADAINLIDVSAD